MALLLDAALEPIGGAPVGQIKERLFAATGSPVVKVDASSPTGFAVDLNASSWMSCKPDYLLLGGHDFTFEGWINLRNTGQLQAILGLGGQGFDLYTLTSGAGYRLRFRRDTENLVDSVSGIAYNAWVHFAVTRTQDTFRIFVNGNLESEVVSSVGFSVPSNDLLVGRNNYYGLTSDLSIAWLRAVRWSDYDANFTPPTHPNLNAIPAAKILDLPLLAIPAIGTGAYDGTATISGVVTENGLPVVRYVRLFDKVSATLVRVTRSKSDGSYLFTGLRPNNEWFVVSHDTENRAYNAVIQDLIRTEP